MFLKSSDILFLRVLIGQFFSGVVGPFTDPEGAGCDGLGHTTAEEKVLLFRPKRGPARSCTTQPAIRTGNLE